jgi:hypothetical protein
LNEAGKDVAKKAGRTPLTFHQLDSKKGTERFHDAITAAKDKLKFGASVHAYDAGEYANTKMYVTPDDKAGFALKPDGDIVSAFSSKSKVQRAGDSILALAVQQGGKKLDAFDTVLPAIYSDNGFRAVARLKWNDEFAPPDWDYKTFGKFNGGRPDVVFMVHDPDNAKPYKPGDGKLVKSYDEAVALQDAAIKEIDKGKGKHPGEGYSKEAYVDKNGVIQTNSVYDAQRALFENRKVELKQVKQVSTLIKRLGETAAEMAEHGEDAPVFNLCNVTVKGTNLFCADQIGIPRAEMPVIPAKRTKDFIAHLKSLGYDIKKDNEESRNLRASQSEISGAKVAVQMQRIKEDGFYKRLVISRDNYILDGHHTWAGQLGLDAKDGDLENDGREVKVARVDISITKLIDEADKWTKAEGIAKKPAGQKEYKLISLKQAQAELDPAAYRKFADIAYRFFAVNTHLGRSIDEILITVPVKEWDESKHPRDPAGEPTGGQFTSGGGGGAAGEGTGTTAVEKPKLDPEVVAVGGDAWNRETAVHLETQYQQARPEIEKLAQAAPGQSAAASTSSDDEDDEAFVPEEWDQLSAAQQDSGKEQWKSQNKNSYIDSEVQNWYDSGGALDDAKYMVAENFNSDFGSNGEWAADALIEYRKEREEAREPELPFTNKQILESLFLTYDHNGEGTGDLKIEFDPTKLQEPVGYNAGQGTLPGIEPMKPEDFLTPEMRESISKTIEDAFDDAAEKKSGSMEAPNYLGDSVDEYMDTEWDDSMDDDSKFNWIKHNTDIIDDSGSSYPSVESESYTDVSELPKKYDPLNDTSGKDYQNTQKLARYLSVKRAVDVLASRSAAAPEIEGTEIGDAEWKSTMEKRLARIDSKLWTAWKQSSTSQDGKLLQVLAAAELGGRLNQKTRDTIDPNAMKNYADSAYSSVGGWAGLRAYTRAKWETTQYLLDKAGIKTLNLYRGISLPAGMDYQKALRHYDAGQDIAGHRYMPTLDVVRNGAASTTTDPSVANDWGGGDRVVLRAQVPRTAAISVPAFGINIKSEHEVVVTGTAWHGWDAWAERAPTFDDVPLKKAA